MKHETKIQLTKAVFWLLATVFSTFCPAPYILFVTPLCARRFVLHTLNFGNAFMEL